MGIKDNQLDFEDFSTDTEKLSAILKRTEISSQKHKLSYEYYRARKFVLLIPATLCCATIGILGFVATTDAIKRHMKINNVQVEDVLTLTIGSLGFVTGMILLLMNQWDFGSHESMHLGALMELENLADKIRFWRMDQKINNDNDVNDNDDCNIDDALDKQQQQQQQKSKNKLDGNIINGSSSSKERRALGVVEAPNSNKVAMVVASGKMLKKVEREIKQKTLNAKKAEERRDDVSR
jgi:hypothetical protein